MKILVFSDNKIYPTVSNIKIMDSVSNNHIGNFDNLSQFMHYPRMSE